MSFEKNPEKSHLVKQRYKYMKELCPYILKEAFFADETEDYVRMKEEKLLIRFRTGKNNVERVFVSFADTEYEMTKYDSETMFDYYQVEIDMPEKTARYYFKAQSGKMVYYYNKQGAVINHNPQFDFRVIPGFHTPDWAKGAVFYQIFVDRFYNGDMTNDVENNEYIYIEKYTKKVEDWNENPEVNDVGRFYGGDLQGVLDKLDYLKDLGVDVIYMNPIFVSPSNHKYDIQDYDHIDPHYGKIVCDEGELLKDGETTNAQASRYISRVTKYENLQASNQLFAKLTEEIHRRGMKVVLDGVFNHCGSFNKWMDREKIYDKNPDYAKGAFVSGDSPFRNFFTFRSENWPENGDYVGWWDHATLPKLNYDSNELQDYILGIAQKWLSAPYYIDGWRLDVAADLGTSSEQNHQFWKDFRKAVKAVNPDALILAEHYGNASEWLQGDEWDTVMNYDAFMEPLTWMLTGLEKHSDYYREDMYGNSDAFRDAMLYHMNSFHKESLYVAMNELSNHDHSRFLTRTNHQVGRLATVGAEAASKDLNYGIFREAVLMQMTWPGAPTLYYGDEAGVCGWTDPDNRRTYPWGHENKELIAFHKEMIRLHKSEPALKTGSYMYLKGGYQWLSYGRFNRKQQMVVVVNNDSKSQKLTLPVWRLGINNGQKLVSLMETTESGYDLEEKIWCTEHGNLVIDMKPYSSILLKTKNVSGC